MVFIAMNRFRVKKGSEDAFEKVWLMGNLSRPRSGFRRISSAQGAGSRGSHALRLAHDLAEQIIVRGLDQIGGISGAHGRAGNETTGPLYLEHPKFEGFEARQTVACKAVA
jgi:hypothetical protein